jgi:hypothetical protein
MAGWRRSANRTRLHANSLLTGNFTGNFEISDLHEPIWRQEISVLQPPLRQFPMQINREIIPANREFRNRNREISKIPSPVYLPALSVFVRNGVFSIAHARGEIPTSASIQRTGIVRYTGMSAKCQLRKFQRRRSPNSAVEQQPSRTA